MSASARVMERVDEILKGLKLALNWDEASDAETKAVLLDVIVDYNGRWRRMAKQATTDRLLAYDLSRFAALMPARCPDERKKRRLWKTYATQNLNSLFMRLNILLRVLGGPKLEKHGKYTRGQQRIERHRLLYKGNLEHIFEKLVELGERRLKALPPSAARHSPPRVGEGGVSRARVSSGSSASSHHHNVTSCARVEMREAPDPRRLSDEKRRSTICHREDIRDRNGHSVTDLAVMDTLAEGRLEEKDPVIRTDRSPPSGPIGSQIVEVNVSALDEFDDFERPFAMNDEDLRVSVDRERVVAGALDSAVNIASPLARSPISNEDGSLRNDYRIYNFYAAAEHCCKRDAERGVLNEQVERMASNRTRLSVGVADGRQMLGRCEDPDHHDMMLSAIRKAPVAPPPTNVNMAMLMLSGNGNSAALSGFGSATSDLLAAPAELDVVAEEEPRDRAETIRGFATPADPPPIVQAYDPDPKATSMVVDENTADPINMIYFSQSGNASHQGSASVSMTGAASASTTR